MPNENTLVYRVGSKGIWKNVPRSKNNSKSKWESSKSMSISNFKNKNITNTLFSYTSIVCIFSPGKLPTVPRYAKENTAPHITPYSRFSSAPGCSSKRGYLCCPRRRSYVKKLYEEKKNKEAYPIGVEFFLVCRRNNLFRLVMSSAIPVSPASFSRETMGG